MTKGDLHLGGHQGPSGGLSNLLTARPHPGGRAMFEQLGRARGSIGVGQFTPRPSTFAQDMRAQ